MESTLHDGRPALTPADPGGLFANGGETGALMRAMDWGATPLGPVARWPQSLRTALSVVLASHFPMLIHWGPERIQLYNDAYAAILHGKHPGALGAPAAEWWAEIWEQLAPIFEAVQRGETTHFEDTLVLPDRRGFVEECYFTFCHSPIRDESGGVGGVFTTAVETTSHVVSARRLATLAELAARTGVPTPWPGSGTAAARAVCRAVTRAVAATGHDVPFAALWLRPDPDAGETAAALVAVDGVSDAEAAWFAGAAARVLATGRPETLALDEGAPRLAGQPWPDPVREARLLPLAPPDPGGAGTGVLLAGLSPRRPVDAAYTGFLDAVAEQAARAVAAAEARLAGEERLRALILQMPSPVALHVGPEHHFALINAAFRRISGGGRDDTGLAVRAAFPELVGQGIFEALDAVYATGESFLAAETPIRFDRDGSGLQDTWFDVRYEPVRDRGGQVIGVLNYAVDVTDQVRARQAVELLLGESERTRAALADANTLLQDQTLELELSNQQLQDQTVELELQAEELHTTAAELEERTVDAEGARQRTEAVLGAIADAFYLLDHEWRFTHVNDAAEPLLLTTRERLLGRTLWEAFPAVAGSEFEPAYRESMTTGRPTTVEAYFAPLGRWFDVRSYGWSGGLMIHFRDVSERRAAEDERDRLLAAEREAREGAEAARVEAEAANLAKSQFLSTMSHELRTPLNAIQGYAELLSMGLRGPVTEAQEADFGRIRRASQHLMGLVTDILNFARLDAGQVEFHVGTVELGPLVADLEALIGPQLAARGLVYDHDACAPATRRHAVRADAEKVRQVLLNLLTNAIKFTAPGGRVWLACDGDAGTDLVRLRVSDSGRGIAPEQIARIFEPFVQVDRHHTHESQQGVGLGLTISRDLARAMGGDLTAESVLGAGSTFTLTLPAA